ncbi:hypothetical protein [Novipirellula artificiosorum]|uniref:hypothetical protein n=1 Tax=Novipirellula artificiosorum TaxID=2528016 RepID=UPI0011B428CE|nr:hypothetical protein [Novipirellula artificiosorum]
MFDFSNSGTQTKLVHAGKEQSIDNDDGSREWTILTARRRSENSSVELNKQQVLDLGIDLQTIKQIGLQSVRGTIAVSNFGVTGNVY